MAARDQTEAKERRSRGPIKSEALTLWMASDGAERNQRVSAETLVQRVRDIATTQIREFARSPLSLALRAQIEIDQREEQFVE